MSIFKKIRNSKLFASTSSKHNNNGKNGGGVPFITPTMTSTSFATPLNIDTTVLSDTITSSSTPFNFSSKNTTLNTTYKANNNSSFIKMPNGDANSIGLNQRNLIVYHIDSETEGTYTFSAKVLYLSLRSLFVLLFIILTC